MKNSPSLEVLILSCNDLTSKGLRNLFLNKNDVRRLNYIDVSGNVDITCRGIVNYVCSLSSIDKIVVSTSMVTTSKNVDQNSFEKLMAEGKFRRKTRPGTLVRIIGAHNNISRVDVEKMTKEKMYDIGWLRSTRFLDIKADKKCGGRGQNADSQKVGNKKMKKTCRP